MGNHPYQNDTVGKLLKIKNGLDAADNSEWMNFLIETEKKFNNMLEEGV